MQTQQLSRLFGGKCLLAVQLELCDGVSPEIAWVNIDNFVGYMECSGQHSVCGVTNIRGLLILQHFLRQLLFLR